MKGSMVHHNSALIHKVIFHPQIMIACKNMYGNTTVSDRGEFAQESCKSLWVSHVYIPTRNRRCLQGDRWYGHHGKLSQARQPLLLHADADLSLQPAQGGNQMRSMSCSLSIPLLFVEQLIHSDLQVTAKEICVYDVALRIEQQV